MTDDPLLAVADGLYAGPAATFIASRDVAAKAADDPELRARIKALRRPSVAAWAVNLLVRREAAQIDQVLGLGSALREAAESMDGDELRALTRQRRQLTTALAASARGLAREADVTLTSAVVEQVEGILNAAMLDPVAADLVRTGLLLTAFTSTGVSEIDVPAVVAVPTAVGGRATATEHPRPDLHVVVPDAAVRREAAQDRVDEAAALVVRAEAALGEVDGSLASLEARRLQLMGEIDELKRRLGELDDGVEEVDQEIEEADEAREEAADELDEARRAHDEASRDLAALD